MLMILTNALQEIYSKIKSKKVGADDPGTAGNSEKLSSLSG